MAHQSREHPTNNPASSLPPMSPQKRRAKRQLEELLWEKNHPGGSLNPERAKGAIPRSSGTYLLGTPRVPRAWEQNQPRRDAAGTLTQTRCPTAKVLGSQIVGFEAGQLQKVSQLPASEAFRICDAAPWSPKPRTPVGAGGKLLQAQRNSVKKEIKKEQLEVLRARGWQGNCLKDVFICSKPAVHQR